MEQELANLQRDHALEVTIPELPMERAWRDSARSELRRLPATRQSRSSRPLEKMLIARAWRRGVWVPLAIAGTLGFVLWSHRRHEAPTERASHQAPGSPSAVRHRSDSETPFASADQPGAVRADHLDPARLEQSTESNAAPTMDAQPTPQSSATVDTGRPQKGARRNPSAEPSPLGRRAPESRRQRTTGIASARTAAGDGDSESTDRGATEPRATGLSANELVRDAAAAFVLGQMPRAGALYREAIKGEPDNADAWRGLGMAKSGMGERDAAARAFRRYLQLRPDAPDAAAVRKRVEAL